MILKCTDSHHNTHMKTELTSFTNSQHSSAKYEPDSLLISGHFSSLEFFVSWEHLVHTRQPVVWLQMESNCVQYHDAKWLFSPSSREQGKCCNFNKNVEQLHRHVGAGSPVRSSDRAARTVEALCLIVFKTGIYHERNTGELYYLDIIGTNFC